MTQLIKLRTRALRLEQRYRTVESRLKSYEMGPSGPKNRETEEKSENIGWFLTIETDGPPVSFFMGMEKPELPLILEIEVTK